ncbi:hypothetical protein BJF78_12810 [Pseudonocardia sp. CNS-139]|nr:hypothetical protein BJF78_12810 [Pseudonocardia sp. CNS-139]
MPPGVQQNGRVPPQRYRPDHPPAGPGNGPGSEPGAPYPSGDMHLLTHEETGSAAVARNTATALVERPGEPEGERRHSRQAPGGRKVGKGGKPATLWKRYGKWVYIGLASLVMAPILAFVIGWIIFPVPSSDEAALAQVARFTYSDGAELATLRPEGSGDGERINRERITLDQVPLDVQRAVLSAEDRSFFSNPGFDFVGIGRAVFNQLTGGVGGGSTITQQYVKKATGFDDYSLWRKYREVVLAVKISREQTKEQILENYLNTIPFGRAATASRPRRRRTSARTWAS